MLRYTVRADKTNTEQQLVAVETSMVWRSGPKLLWRWFFGRRVEVAYSINLRFGGFSYAQFSHQGFAGF
jgi:hypothetical protein